ncbi:MAG: CT583 family protein [Verrucomicrobia bacterium]|nr:CT583 family protein [Verrucomicrobiota bacterium]
MMSKFNDLLHLRFKQKESKQKMTALVERSNNGELSSFSGVFRVSALNEKEKETLEEILKSFRKSDTHDVDADLKALMTITSEVKAITNQAVILHGERIKRAQEILKTYRDGAFTAWLFATYGNRQTPYNFLQYYEFYTVLPQALHTKLDQMPRQAIYTLASRAGAFERKEEIVRNYSGQPKQELIKLIRQEFPLSEDDKRMPNFSSNAISFLKRARDMLKNPHCQVDEEEKRQINHLLAQIRLFLEKR